MQKLTEMDSSFLQQETPRTPMHISPILVYDQSARRDHPVRFKEILTTFECNLHKSTIFRRKLAGGAFGLDTPYWVEDPDFDLEFHVRHIALPQPGDWRQFCILLARLHARGLDMKRPLWEAYVIEGLNKVAGLPKHSFAIMLKIHHSAIDGISGAEIITAIHSLTDELVPPPADDPWRGESDPSEWQVWSQASVNTLRRPATFFDKIQRLVPAVIRANRQSAEHRAMQRAPMVRCRFNGPVSSTRVTDALIMDLEQVKAIRRAVEGATVNDAIVAIVGGGLRKYLQSKNELPDTTLSCTAPINMRQGSSSTSSGNQVSNMTISMATDIADPLERLRAVNLSARESKAYAEALGTSVIMDMSEIMVPQVLGWSMRAVSLATASSNVPLPFNVVISNVPGPQATLYLAGARLDLIMGMGPLLHTMGLFHGVFSAAGRITINFLSCREMLPDPAFYQQCLREAFEELRRATQRAASAAARSMARPNRARLPPV
ncbi:MAG: wax ester/triacylglycerol synthase family O-acyltransferase [Pseudomonadales bacterium]|nr:wax ester/triacylglycerol synthase family O-acyltransferase [Pseudomonadales bacterium]MCP5192048.1 wax ester/triacylglycerol synthase family O-acyltransferase [Pseudomonadales bacterium]